jgi:nicotinate-nucleotide--dimethylbenzimidazole phosphoribosyltransferase
MKKFQIFPRNRDMDEAIQAIIDQKTKPIGALGALEQLALQAAAIQETLTPAWESPHILVFAGDHGITQEGVSPYPAAVTAQMVLNFVRGGAAINVFCRQHELNLRVVDAGVNFDFSAELPIIHQKIGHGTKNFLHEPAMSLEQVEAAIRVGSLLVAKISFSTNCNLIGFGEMGIGNTSAAALIMSEICQLPLYFCVGKGTGLDEEGLQHKMNILQKAQAAHPQSKTPLEILQTFGGFEIAQMVGAILQAAENQMLILVDGFIATAAFLVAHAMEPNVIDYAVFCHQSDEQGHKRMLEFLKASPLLHLGLRLGEGTGAALAFPLLDAALRFFNEMASFEQAEVTNKEDDFFDQL